MEPVETYLYRPLRRATLAVARVAKKLQSGRLNAYVAYMLFALLGCPRAHGGAAMKEVLDDT